MERNFHGGIMNSDEEKCLVFSNKGNRLKIDSIQGHSFPSAASRYWQVHDDLEADYFAIQYSDGKIEPLGNSWLHFHPQADSFQ
jgi:hypothetical protein